jgi:PTH1 family peptidyl-tRNA hydrolase
MDPADFVLRDFSVPERKELPFVLSDAVDAVTGVLERGWDRAQNTVNAERKSRNSS